MKIQISGEDYLKGILVLERKNKVVRSVDLARYQNVSKASVSKAVSTLKEGGFLTMDENFYLQLTDKGREVAEAMYERHTFFRDQLIKLGVDPEVAAEDACKLEHAISKQSFQKLKEKLES